MKNAEFHLSHCIDNHSVTILDVDEIYQEENDVFNFVYVI